MIDNGTKVILTAGPYSGYEGEIVCSVTEHDYHVAVKNVAVIQINDKYFKISN